MLSIFFLLSCAQAVLGGSIVYDGRAQYTLTETSLDTSTGPYLTGVKGSENASHYSTLLGHSSLPTALWNRKVFPFLPVPTEQVIAISIDNSSVFAPGGGNHQYGFRRTELIAQKNGSHGALNAEMEVGVTLFHFSIKLDPHRPLNYNHEYQAVFIEPNDGSHIFGIQLGSPFTNPTGPLPNRDAHSFKVLDHALNVLFSTPFSPKIWHNFAVRVDWDLRTLQVFYSKNGFPLQMVTRILPNPTTAAGPAGQGDFHFGILKLPIVNAADSPENQGDVVHYGIQEGTTEGLFYSGVFVERS